MHIKPSQKTCEKITRNYAEQKESLFLILNFVVNLVVTQSLQINTIKNMYYKYY